MSKELIKELELLREYSQKKYLEPRLKLLIDYIDDLEKENFNLREDTYIEKMSFPSEGRNIKELMEMPTYQELQEENKRLREVTTDTYESSQEIIGELTKENKKLHNKIDKAIEVLDEILVYDDFSDITQGFGNVKEELKFYLSECKTWEDFRKKNEILKDSDVDE